MIGWITVGIGWFVFIANIVFERHLTSVRDQFIPKKFLSPEYASTRWQSLKNIDSMGDDLDESTKLVDTFQGSTSVELPGWCDVDIHKFRSSRNPLVRRLVGGQPNRQQALFLMDIYGPKLYFLLLQSNLIFTGVYAGVILLVFLPYLYELYWWPFFGLFTVLACLPVLGISQNKKKIVAALAQVTSIGAYRKPQIVSDVLLETKTARVVRTFLIIHKMWNTAKKGASLTLSEKQMKTSQCLNSLSTLEKNEVTKSFDAFDSDGSKSITHAEFRNLLKRLGADMSDEDFSKTVSTLDADDDGVVIREEFLEWYATQSQADKMTLSDRAQDLFKMFDCDRSGEITIGEFKLKLDALEMGFTVDEIGAIVKELDRDGSGTVGQAEFEALLEKYYPRELLG